MTERSNHENEARTEPLGTEVFDSAPDDATGTRAPDPAAPASAETAETERLDEATAPLDAAGRSDEPTVPEETTAPAAAAGVADPRPRIRFAGIAWGVVFATAALVLLGVVTDPVRRRTAAQWLGSLEGDTAAIILALVLGAVLVLGALLASVRRLQRSRSDA